MVFGDIHVCESGYDLGLMKGLGMKPASVRFARNAVPPKAANGSDGANTEKGEFSNRRRNVLTMRSGSRAMSPKVKVEPAGGVPCGVTYHEITRDDKIVR